MPRAPYRHRHSVWIDVFGVLIFGAVLLGGAGYLLYQSPGMTGRSATVGASVQNGPSPMQGPKGRSPAPRPNRLGLPDGGSGPLLGSRSGRAPSAPETPFSDEWQEQATPDLGGQSGSPGGALPGMASGGAGSGGEPPAPDRSGPAIASRQQSGGAWGTQTRSEAAGSGWQEEARRLSGQARALSSQLRQLDQSSSQQSREATSSEGGSGQASTASASNNDRDPGDPPSVPIGDHLPWLAAAGILWGAWRIARGG
jgi:hypothetical protein